jgi:predicted nucleic acid-binding protein
MILVDNTVLSNFALVDELPLLKQFCKGLGATSEYVLSEFEKGVQEGKKVILKIRIFPGLRNWI